TISDVAVDATGGFTVTGKEGFDTGPQTVATFTDPAGAEALANYSATIDWGDGSSSAGVITFNSGTNVFTVTRSHTYAQDGTPTITVTIHHETAPDAAATSSGLIRPISDIAGRSLTTGQWQVSVSNGSNSSTNAIWATWNPNATWVDVITGDFNGDGRADY